MKLTYLFPFIFICPTIAMASLEKNEFTIAEKPILQIANEENKITAYTKDDLIKNEIFTQRIFKEVVLTNNESLISDLLPIYETFSKHDKALAYFAKAKIAILKQDYLTAIDYYKKSLKLNPNVTAINIKLAELFFQDRQLKNAKHYFLQAKQDPQMPKAINHYIDNYLASIKKQNEWDFDFNANYVADKNINNVANTKEIEGTAFLKPDERLPQSAHGVEYNAGFSKDVNLLNNHYFSFSNHLTGEYYWDNHDYNNIINKTYLGYKYKTAKYQLGFLPFYKKMWSDNENYSWSNGVKITLFKYLNQQFNLSTTAQFSKRHYFDNNDLNSINKSLSGSLSYHKDSKNDFYFGIDFSQEKAKDNYYSNHIVGLNMGWLKKWDKDIFTNLNFNISNKKYKEIAKYCNSELCPSFGKKRNDKIQAVDFSIWKNDWTIWGLVPKLNFNWKKQNSNIPTMYSYTKKNINIIIERSF